MSKVAIIYYSQTGQSQRIAELLYGSYKTAGNSASLIPLHAKQAYAFPWKINRFFAQMPLCMENAACEIEDLGKHNFNEFDRVVLVHPVWFLSASLPVQALLSAPWSEHLFRGKKVVQILTCRNMWLSAAKKTRAALIKLGAHYSGQIIFEDPSPNWASLVTTPRWMLTGKKEAFAFFPSAGIPESHFFDFAATASQKLEGLFEGYTHSESPMSRAKAVSLSLESFGHFFVFKPWAKLAMRSPLFVRGLVLIGFRLSLVLTILILVPSFEIVSRAAPFLFLSFARKQQLRLNSPT